MKYLSRFSLVVLLVAPHALMAEEVRVSCSNIADAAERLACFDRTFPGVAGGVAGGVAPQTDVDAQTKAVKSETPTTTAGVEKPAPLSKGGMLSKKAKLNISSRLKSVRDSEKQKMVFLLENDQIWIQDSPRSLPFTEGQDVTIKSGTIGGYSMSNAEGVSTRVRRIK